MKKNSNTSVNSNKMPKFWTLCAKTWQELTAFWRPLIGVLLVYGALYFALILGFSIAYSYQDIADSVDAQLGGTTGWFAKSSLTVINLFAYSNQSDAAAVVQFLLFVIASLAFIWVLRQLRALKHIRIRDAYFDGTARIVPATLVIMLLLLPFIPAAIGSVVFSISQLGSSLELIVGAIIAGLSLLLSLYWLVAWLPAIYIVSLPKGTPINAIKSSLKLTKKRRLWMLRNISIFTLISLLISFFVMLLFVLAAPKLSVIAAYVVSFILFGILQTFLFIMYRNLLDES